MYLVGWVDEQRETVAGIKIPGFLSLLVHGDARKPIKGLQAFAKRDRPPVNLVFQSYHLMVGMGMALIGISLLAAVLCPGGRLFRSRWVLRLLVVSVLLPQAANQLGWLTAEVGRQPWIVYEVMLVEDAVTNNRGIWLTLALLIVVYANLAFLATKVIRGMTRRWRESDHVDLPTPYGPSELDVRAVETVGVD